MICQKCGAENFGEKATLCSFCGKPLSEDPIPSDPDDPIRCEELPEEPQAPEPPQDAAGDDEDKINLSDPIDFIMSQPEPEVTLDMGEFTPAPDPPAPPAEPTHNVEEQQPEPRAEFDLFSQPNPTPRPAQETLPENTSEVPGMSPVQEPSATAAESEAPPSEPVSEPVSDGPQSEPAMSAPLPEPAVASVEGTPPAKEPEPGPPPVIKPVFQPQARKAEPSPAVKKPEPVAAGAWGGAGHVYRASDSDEIKSKIATRRMEAEDTKKGRPPTLSIRQPEIERFEGAEMPRVAKSKGIIFLSGDSLVLTGGTKVASGEQIQIGEKVFEVRPKPKDQRRNMAIIAGGSALLILILAYLSGLISFGDGRLVGVVLGAGNYPVQEVVVRIAEKNESVTTNQAGFFIFDDLESGLYTIQVLEDGKPVVEEKIAVVDDELTTLVLFESKTASYTPKSKETRSPPSSPKKEVESKAVDNFGTVKLTLSPKDAKAYLDDKPLGTGSNDYNIKPGKYVLSAKKSGYKSKSRTITVAAGSTSSYEFTLTKEAQGQEKTDREKAYELEVSGKYKEALKSYDKVLSKKPKDLWALMGKARCYRAQGLSDQAVTLFSQAAGIAAQEEDAAAQIDALTAIIEVRPNTITAYNGRADLYFESGEYSKAADDYETIVKFDRHNINAVYKLGESYYQARDYSGAVQAFKAAEEINFADPKAQVCQAKAYFMLGDKKSMKKNYERFKELATYATRLQFKKDPEWQKVLAALGAEE